MQNFPLTMSSFYNIVKVHQEFPSWC